MSRRLLLLWLILIHHVLLPGTAAADPDIVVLERMCSCIDDLWDGLILLLSQVLLRVHVIEFECLLDPSSSLR